MTLNLFRFFFATLISGYITLAPECAQATISGASATNDSANLYYQFTYSGTPQFLRVYLDTDRNESTGFRFNGIGANYLIENGNLHRYSGSNGAWGWTRVKAISMTKANSTVRWTVGKADVGSPAAVNLLLQHSDPTTTSAIISQTVTAVSTTTTLRPTTTTLSPPPTTLPVASTGPTYYVSPTGNDANSGSASAPWRTIQKAANMVLPGDTVILMNGSYEEPAVIFTRSGTAAKPIVFKAQNKWMAILASTSGCQPGFSIKASYIKVKDIRFSVSSRNVTCATYTSTNVHIRAWNTRIPTPSNPSTGAVGFVADGIKVDFAARSEGVKSNQDDTIIENSEFDHSIELFAVKDSHIRNNIVTRQDRAGISILAKGGVRNAQIYGNVVYNKAANGRGIIIGGFSCDTCFFDTSAKIEAYNSVAYNNVVINQSTGAVAALKFEGAKDSAFFNNVVINGQLGMSDGGYNTGFRYRTTNPTYKNNIVVCNGGVLTSGYYGWLYSGTLSVDYNQFSNCSSGVAQAHSISGSVSFVNAASDWHLQPGSAGINSGTPISFVGYGGVMLDLSRDKNGVVRSTPWDLGIYNVTP